MKYFKITPSICVALLLTACQSDKKTEMEERQALEKRVELLESKVDTMMDEMQLERAIKTAEQEGRSVKTIQPQE